MNRDTINVVVDPDPAAIQPIHDALDAYNQSKTGHAEKKTVAAFYRLDDGTLVGGGIAIIQAGWLFIDTLWVAESHRGSGIGSALLARLEEAAVLHGLRWARLNTTDFQAPEFYRRRGYRVFAEIPLSFGPSGSPESTFFFMRKDL